MAAAREQEASLAPLRAPANRRQWRRSSPCACRGGANLSTKQGLFKFKQYQVVGRHLPTDSDPSPTLYRMKVWASDDVRARSKFW